MTPAERARRERMAAWTRDRLAKGQVVFASLVAGYHNTHIVPVPNDVTRRINVEDEPKR